MADLITHHATGLRVDPVTGLVIGKRGKPIGRRDVRGQVEVYVWDPITKRCRFLKAHRIVWQAVHGEIPAGHVVIQANGIKHDNRARNLVAVPRKRKPVKGEQA